MPELHLSPPRRATWHRRVVASVRRHRTILLVTLLWSLALHWWEPELLWHSHSPAFEPLRSMGVLDAWAQGIWDARWLPLFDKGYGYPIFSYHSPLFSMVTATFLALTGLPVLAMKLAVVLFFVIGGLGCRTLASGFWARPGGRDEEAGDLAFVGWGSVTYLFTNVFVRGSFAEFAASCFFPWVVLGVWLLSRGGGQRLRGGLVLAASLALVILCHNAIAAYVILLLLLPMWVLFPPDGWRGWFAWAGGGAAAFAMTAFFAVAAVVEKPFVRLDAVIGVDFHDHFLRLGHLFAAGQWNTGVSGQDPLCTMPRHQGLLLPFVLLAGLLAYRLFQRPDLRRKLVAALAFAGITVLMAMRPSAWIWEHVGVLRYTQFPWRWLSLNATTLALLVPALGIALRQRREDALRQAFFVGLAAVFLVNLAAYGGPNHGWRTWRFETDEAAIRGHDERTTLDDEYGPIWRPTRLTHPVVSGGLRAPDLDLRAPASVSGATWRWELPQRPAPEKVLVGLNYFPAWTARWHDASGGARDLTVRNDAGLVEITLPTAAAGLLEVHLSNTPLRFWLKILSAAALAAYLAALYLYRRSRRPAPIEASPPDSASGFTGTGSGS